jgi:hypothetical protein
MVSMRYVVLTVVVDGMLMMLCMSLVLASEGRSLMR